MLKKLLLICCLVLPGYFLLAQDFPEKPTTLVVDYTNTLKPDELASLENKLVAFDDSTSTQIAVVIMRSVGSYDIAQYGTELGRKWGIGTKGKDNGILVLVALSDRKMTIQTGYGAEGAVPDAITSKIIENDMKPNFRENNYYAGLDAATTSLMQYMKGEYKADKVAKKNGESGGGGSIAVIVFIVIVILILIFRNMGGGGGQVMGRRGSASPFWWFLFGSSIGGGFGGNRDNDSGWGGGGSSGGGGGFGGFGGGSFGGGGSSGSW